MSSSSSNQNNNNSIAVVLGNGSSLREFDFQKQLGGHDESKVTTIGTCAAYRHWHKINWFPTHYVNMDHVVLSSHAAAIRRMIEEKRCKTFFLRRSFIRSWPQVGQNDSVVFLEDLRKSSPVMSQIRSFCSGMAATMYALHLGFKDVRLMGADCDYVEFIPECKQLPNGELEITKTPDHNPNYFIDDYQQKGDRYNKPNGTQVHKKSWEQLSGFISKNTFPGSPASVTNFNPKVSLGELFPKVDDINRIVTCSVSSSS